MSEISVLNAILYKRGAAVEIFDKLTADDFHVTEWSERFASWATVYADNPAHLKSDDFMFRVETDDILQAAIRAHCDYGQTVAEMIDIVIQSAAKERVAAKLARLTHLSGDSSLSAGQLSNELRDACEAIHDPRLDGHEDDNINAVFEQYVADAYDYKKGVRKSAVTWGLSDLDDKMPLRPNTYAIIAARPGHGKTALACSLIEQQLYAGIKVGLIGMEMPASDYLQRLQLCAMGGSYNFAALVEGKWLDDKLASASAERMRAVAHKHLRLYCRRADITQIVSRCRKWISEGVQVIYIDYIQLIGGDAKHRGDRRLEMIDISLQLHGLMMEHGVPIVALAQLNRAAGGEVPRTSHLKESGSLEQDATGIILLDRPAADKPARTAHPYQDNGAPMDMDDKCAVIVGKNRSGPTGLIFATYHAQAMKFSTMDRR